MTTYLITFLHKEKNANGFLFAVGNSFDDVYSRIIQEFKDSLQINGCIPGIRDQVSTKYRKAKILFYYDEEIKNAPNKD